MNDDDALSVIGGGGRLVVVHVLDFTGKERGESVRSVTCRDGDVTITSKQRRHRLLRR